MKLLEPNFSWQKFLLSWHGRVPRRQYWVLAILLISLVGNIVAGIIDMSVFKIDPMSGDIAPASVFYTLLTLWPMSVILIKRAHDINLSAWQYFRPMIIALAIVAFGMLLMIAKKDILQQDSTMKMAFIAATAVLSGPFFIYSIWLGLLASFKRGTDGDNRFGLDIRQQIVNQNKVIESNIT